VEVREKAARTESARLRAQAEAAGITRGWRGGGVGVGVPMADFAGQEWSSMGATWSIAIGSGATMVLRRPRFFLYSLMRPGGAAP
jgi:hypothetical protein